MKQNHIFVLDVCEIIVGGKVLWTPSEFTQNEKAKKCYASLSPLSIKRKQQVL